MSVDLPNIESLIRVAKHEPARARRRVVIVGCGFGGLFVAQALPTRRRRRDRHRPPSVSSRCCTR